MRYRSFPGDGQSVSALGLGCMRFPDKDGAVDREYAVSLIRAAIDGGVNYVDTAYAYHGGESENIVGQDVYKRQALISPMVPMEIRSSMPMPVFSNLRAM